MKTIEYNCSNCNIPCIRPAKGNFWGKFCSNVCQNEWQYKRRIEQWLAGDLTGWTGKTRSLTVWVRRWLHENRGTACELCGWDVRHPVDNAVLTEIDHIDGDAENCRPENLKVLCPNCHSMTPTFRARNKKSTRTRS